MRVILQNEAAECGLACLAMILSHYKREVELSDFRVKYQVSLGGARLSDLITMSNHVGLVARPVRIELEDIEHLDLPAIIHWNLNHFVVLKKVKSGSIIILDPAHGKRNVSMTEFSESFTGVALELSPDENFKTGDFSKPLQLRELFSGITGLFPIFCQILILMLFVQAAAIAAPLFLKFTIDTAISDYDFQLLTILAFSFGSLFILANFINAARDWAVIVLSESLAYQMIRNVISHLFKLRLQYFEARHMGDIVSRIHSINSIERALSRGLLTAIISASLMVVLIVALFLYSVKLALIIICLTLVSVLVSFYVYPIARDRKSEAIISDAHLQSYTMEGIRGIKSIKLFNQENRRTGTWSNEYIRTQNKRLAEKLIRVIEAAGIDMLNSLQTVLVTYFGALLVLNGDITLGSLVAILAYQASFIGSADSLREVVVEFSMIRVHLDRLSDIVRAVAEEKSDQALSGPSPLALSVVDIDFKYGENEKYVLQSASLDIGKGKCIGIFGDSGSGKTTLFKVLTGFLSPNSGSIVNGGVKVVHCSGGIKLSRAV